MHNGIMSEKHVYRFGSGMTDGDAGMKNLLGGKGANLAEMATMDIPVPPGFTITTEVCTHFNENEQNYPKELEGQMKNALKNIEEQIPHIDQCIVEFNRRGRLTTYEVQESMQLFANKVMPEFD